MRFAVSFVGAIINRPFWRRERVGFPEANTVSFGGSEYAPSPTVLGEVYVIPIEGIEGLKHYPILWGREVKFLPSFFQKAGHILQSSLLTFFQESKFF